MRKKKEIEIHMAIIKNLNINKEKTLLNKKDKIIELILKNI